MRGALDAAADDPAVVSAVARMATLARTWLALGQAGQAADMLAPITASEHANGTLLMPFGHALVALGRKTEAERVFRRWVQADPESRDAALQLASLLADTERPREAETITRADIERRGRLPEATFVLARSLLAQARFEEAETAFREVVHARPEHQMAQSNLMEVVWMRTGNVRAACAAIDEFLRAHPYNAGLRVAKARLLVSAQMAPVALAEIEAGLALSAGDVALLRAAAAVALEFDGSRALAYARRLLAAAPNDPAGRVALGGALLAVGRAADALKVATSLERATPPDGRVLAMKADALRLLGDSRGRELLDYQRLVRAGLLEVPDGWTSLDGYLTDLVADIERLHTLSAHPIGNSLRQGSQVQLLPQTSPYASIRAFPQAIGGPIRRYLRALGTGSDPMRSRNTGRYRLSGMWSVRLRPHGFHVNHYHPAGWISSACYLRLPPSVAGHAGEGWLKFGEPAFPTKPALGPEYFVRPAPGLLVLFPAYMWHGTVPFSGSEADSRLTIAFDVVPGTSE